jgi:hypothetical protein
VRSACDVGEAEWTPGLDLLQYTAPNCCLNSLPAMIGPAPVAMLFNESRNASQGSCARGGAMPDRAG